jgi:hypothetical protein
MPRSPRIGYVPMSSSLTQPGDRRRFVHWARARGVEFELATPEGDFDVVVVSSAADITRWARVSRGQLVFDLVDSYFAIPRTDWRGLLRGTAKFLSRQHRHFEPSHWHALAQMCRRAQAVVCSTEEQRADISRYCPNVHVILDVHSAAARVVKRDYAAHEPFRFVWEGLPFTLPQLFELAPVLSSLARPWELHVVTNPSAPRWLGRFGTLDTRSRLAAVFPQAHFHEWTDATFAQTVTACDLALIPLDLDDPFTRGKPENKLLLFWRVGMPVAAAASPAYERAMRAAGHQLASRTSVEWATTLERLMSDETLRRSSAEAGRAWAEQEHSEAKILSRWDSVMESVGVNGQR